MAAEGWKAIAVVSAGAPLRGSTEIFIIMTRNGNSPVMVARIGTEITVPALAVTLSGRMKTAGLPEIAGMSEPGPLPCDCVENSVAGLFALPRNKFGASSAVRT